MKVGFVGVGNMGYHMAMNLIKKGHKVSAFDVSATALSQLESHGAVACKTASHVAEGADAIITMLPSNNHVKNVYKETLPLISQGTLCIDSSTIDPGVAREIGAQVESEAKAIFVDAPVSGGVGGAEKGTLTFMVGGTDDAFQKVNPILKNMGANIVHCGGLGTGQVAKLCNNMVLGISMLGVAESMNLGVKLGIDRKVLAGILNTSSARCWSSDTYNPCPGVLEGVPATRDYEGGFGSALMLKDLGLASDAAKSVGAPIPMGDSAHGLYQLIVSHGLGRKDFGIAYKFFGGTPAGTPSK